MVKGKTKSGIAFKIDERIKDDARVTYLLVRMQSDIEPLEVGRAMNDLLALIFGSSGGVYAFMNEVAAKHGGVCSNESMLQEITEIFEAIKAKN